MGRYVIAFQNKEQMTDGNIRAALSAGTIDRIDVTPDQVLERMTKQDQALHNEITECRFGLITTEKSQRRKELVEVAKVTGYFKRYEETLNSIPVDTAKIRKELLEKWELVSMETNEVIGYGHIKRMP